MRLAHISDLHLGKRLHEISFLEDQAYILEEICKILRDEKPDAVLIAGDIYDKSAPSAEARAFTRRASGIALALAARHVSPPSRERNSPLPSHTVASRREPSAQTIA